MFKFIWHYVVYLFGSKSGKGYGIHSPFVFGFTRSVLSGNKNDAAVRKIRGHIKELKQSREVIPHSRFGAGSKTLSNRQPLNRLIAREAIPLKYGSLLYRLVLWSDSKYIVELGTSVGISTLFMASASQEAKVFTVEGDPARFRLASENFARFGIANVTLHGGSFDEELPRILNTIPRADLVFFDGDHTKSATLASFERCVAKSGTNSIFVFDDIRWSDEMFEAWTIIANDPRVSVSIDLFRVGIVFFRKGIVKQHFKIFY